MANLWSPPGFPLSPIQELKSCFFFFLWGGGLNTEWIDNTSNGRTLISKKKKKPYTRKKMVNLGLLINGLGWFDRLKILFTSITHRDLSNSGGPPLDELYGGTHKAGHKFLNEPHQVGFTLVLPHFLFSYLFLDLIVASKNPSPLCCFSRFFD